MKFRRDLLQRLRETPGLFREIQDDAASELALQQRLRERYDPDLVRAALSVAAGRRKATGVLPNADQLWLTETSLEQSTHPLVAAHKASRFSVDETVLDLCCGLGSDAVALSERGPVEIVDADAAQLMCCEWNLSAWGQTPTSARTSDAESIDVAGRLLHVDPDRRTGRARPVRRLEQYTPNLAWMQSVVQSATGGAIKIGPASNFIQKFPQCEIELTSLHGECREATVWFGTLAEREQFRATVLPSGETIAAAPLSAWAAQASEPGRYIYDPDPAVVRSGLVDAVGERLGLQRLDGEEEYLTSDSLVTSGFVTAFEVQTTLPNNEKQLRRYLRESPSGRYEVKCRHLPVDATAVAKRLPTGRGESRVVFFLRVQARSKIVVASRVTEPQQ